jgi:soluble lytic murein transglycosylase-like protein
VGRASAHTRRLVVAGALLCLLGAALVVVLDRRGDGRDDSAVGPGVVGGVAAARALAYDPDRRAHYEAQAALGLSHVLYAKSPGGVLASAQRTARWRPLIDRVAARHGLPPAQLEAIVFLESAGRPDARASTRLSGAAGLTQILAETGRDLLGLHIEVKTSERLTRGIERGRKVARRERRRRQVDERFDPAKALEATARYLDFAKAKLGRDDLALVAYHMGVGNLQRALAAYGGEGGRSPTGHRRPEAAGRSQNARQDAPRSIPYAQLYFDSSPLRHAAAWRKLASLGDDSSTYLWRVFAAEQIMTLYRTDRAGLERLITLQGHKASAEEVLHPEGSTKVFADPDAVKHARASGALRVLGAADLSRFGLYIDPRMGELAGKLGQKPPLYRALRPGALSVLEAIGAGTRAIARTGPLVVTSTVRDERYQRALARTDIEATHAYSLHTTGWAFDIARTYRSRAQALAFQFMLDRLTALGRIAWVREPGAIHVTVAG